MRRTHFIQQNERGLRDLNFHSHYQKSKSLKVTASEKYKKFFPCSFNTEVQNGAVFNCFAKNGDKGLQKSPVKPFESHNSVNSLPHLKLQKKEDLKQQIQSWNFRSMYDFWSNFTNKACEKEGMAPPKRKLSFISKNNTFNITSCGLGKQEDLGDKMRALQINKIVNDSSEGFKQEFCQKRIVPKLGFRGNLSFYHQQIVQAINRFQYELKNTLNNLRTLVGQIKQQSSKNYFLIDPQSISPKQIDDTMKAGEAVEALISSTQQQLSPVKKLLELQKDQQDKSENTERLIIPDVVDSHQENKVNKNNESNDKKMGEINLEVSNRDVDNGELKIFSSECSKNLRSHEKRANSNFKDQQKNGGKQFQMKASLLSSFNQQSYNTIQWDRERRKSQSNRSLDQKLQGFEAAMSKMKEALLPVPRPKSKLFIYDL